MRDKIQQIREKALAETNKAITKTAKILFSLVEIVMFI